MHTSTIVVLAALHMGWLKFLAVFLTEKADMISWQVWDTELQPKEFKHSQCDIQFLSRYKLESLLENTALLWRDTLLQLIAIIQTHQQQSDVQTQPRW